MPIPPHDRPAGDGFPLRPGELRRVLKFETRELFSAYQQQQARHSGYTAEVSNSQDMIIWRQRNKEVEIVQLASESTITPRDTSDQGGYFHVSGKD